MAKISNQLSSVGAQLSHKVPFDPKALTPSGQKLKQAGEAASKLPLGPARANAIWNDFAAALGISKQDAEAVTALNARIGAYPKAQGKYAPAFEQLSPDLQALAAKVSRSLLGEDVGPLTSLENAFKANLVLNNLTWHMTNWQRAALDPTRSNPLERNNVFNTYSDNLAYASARGGIAAVIDMAISDAYNAGKPGVGKAALLQASTGSTFEGQVSSAQTNRLSGEIARGAQARVPQRNVFDASE